MSELIEVHAHTNIRRCLMVTASAIAISAGVSVDAMARDDSDHPSVWIEIGGQLDRINGTVSPFTAPFIQNNPNADTFTPVSPLQVQRAPRYGEAFEGKLSFAPSGSDWVFSASVRYGRSTGNKKSYQQTHNPKYLHFSGSGVPVTEFITTAAHNFTSAQSRHDESHAILDFQAGRDVGLGIFGNDGGESTLSLGVRSAQFSSAVTTDIKSRPDRREFNLFPTSVGTVTELAFNVYELRGESHRSFRGIGPSLSWNSSLPLIGNPDAGRVMFDWGINGAVLFGRQKARVSHQTSAHYGRGPLLYIYNTLYQPPPHSRTQSRSVAVPNVGGFAGVSLKFPNAKVSFGYRVDFFFGAMDTGIDSHKSADVSFHGPFASISVGLGG
jgi:hypothetical protein